jgi:hypothetical protein
MGITYPGGINYLDLKKIPEYNSVEEQSQRLMQLLLHIKAMWYLLVVHYLKQKLMPIEIFTTI